MKILVDTHTHTNASTHAFSTIAENTTEAKKIGLDMICMTNHAPALPDAPHIWHFASLKRLPRVMNGVKLAFGAEANIIDKNGNIDLPEFILKDMEVVIASIHHPCYTKGTIEEHTRTYLGAIKNPYVTIIGHSGTFDFGYDIDTVIKCAKEYNKCIEINNGTFKSRSKSVENCRKIAIACKKYGTNVVVGSDAHSAYEVGVFDDAIKLLEDIDFPEELIMNTSAEKFEDYLRIFGRYRG